MKLSEKLELILGLCEQCKSDYNWYKKQQEAEEGKQNNIQHELEGVGSTNQSPPAYKERARLATEYQSILIARRIAKDNKQLNEPVAIFLDSETGRNAINQ